MKLKLIVIAAFCFIANAVNSATDVPSVTITRMEDSSSIFLVNYSGNKIGTIVVVVKDSKDEIVLTKWIKATKDFSLPVNFSSVAEGTYTIQIDNGNGNEKLTRTLTYTNDTAPTYSHVVSLGDKRYLFTSSHSGAEKISIRIYDGEGNLVFEKEKLIQGDFAMLFNLRKISGTPSFEVSEKNGRSTMVPGNPIVMEIEKQ